MPTIKTDFVSFETIFLDCQTIIAVAYKLMSDNLTNFSPLPPVLGWRIPVSQLNIPKLNAQIDTEARSSVLLVDDIENSFQQGEKQASEGESRNHQTYPQRKTSHQQARSHPILTPREELCINLPLFGVTTINMS